MRKILCFMLTVLLCFALCLSALAAEGEFVPSISYKDSPDIDDAQLQEEDVSECLVITSILAAQEKTTDITQDTRDLLLEVYSLLDDGSMTLPLEKDYVIRELVDISFRQSECIEPGHPHEDELEKPGVTISVTFDLDIAENVPVVVMQYHDGQWIPVAGVVNNGDGTVSCVFEHFCPVAFCVYEDDMPSQTGDNAGRTLILWIALMVLSAAAVVTMLVMRRRQER